MQLGALALEWSWLKSVSFLLDPRPVTTKMAHIEQAKLIKSYQVKEENRPIHTDTDKPNNTTIKRLQRNGWYLIKNERHRLSQGFHLHLQSLRGNK